jgi:hypothetical protein
MKRREAQPGRWDLLKSTTAHSVMALMIHAFAGEIRE